LTFGDKSWGSIKIGKDLGLFGQDAILNDQTLLGVGSQGIVGPQGGTTTTLGRIGTGFLYADFTGQIDYMSPNWNGFSFVAGITQPWQTLNLATSAGTTSAQKAPAWEGKASYEWAGDFAGKAWVEGFSQKVDGLVVATGISSKRADVWAVGGKVGFSGFGLTGYYYNGTGVGTTGLLMDGFAAGTGNRRDSDGGYVQLDFTIPGVGTKIAGSWGESKLDLANGEVNPTLVKKNEMWTLGAYHPLTKHVNLVAEYSNVRAENQAGARNTSNIVDLGAILFF
jgi:predicted porin